ncbi:MULTISPECIES: hypothetical protein [unclassified Bradyrhizobium]|uniref:hypothetical protein n=1 Tax=unclassified Bradyrhizobium TaxID=2631580 RepID=UPI001BAC3FF2|nr:MULTISPECIES: hypothetical protein [unclassified Bradyrhizobium]MBR1157513.1 hypothetical protein [Bradyrhizobium sp. JYMT SZCCT0428]
METVGRQGYPRWSCLQPPHLKALDAWIDKQKEPYTRPEAIRGMIEAMLNILAKDTGEKPVKKAKSR